MEPRDKVKERNEEEKVKINGNNAKKKKRGGGEREKRLHLNAARLAFYWNISNWNRLLFLNDVKNSDMNKQHKKKKWNKFFMKALGSTGLIDTLSKIAQKRNQQK